MSVEAPNDAAEPVGRFTIGDAPPETTAEAVARLARLAPLEYDQQREAEAKRLKVRVATLDKEVASARGEEAGDAAGQGRKLTIARPEPWPEPVDGAALLDDIAAFLARHVFLPAVAADAIAAWVLHTYCHERFRHTPRLTLTSSDKRCGKTTLLDAIRQMACRPLPTANITVAGLFRTIELAAPTLLIDEADTFLHGNEDLRGAINAGHKRGERFVRTVGEDHEPRAFNVFAPAAIAAIGTLPGTIADRSILVRMQRATRAERPAPLNATAEAAGARLARMAERWCRDHGTLLPEAPELPAELFNRAADNWRPLFAIAALTQGGWPERLAAAAARMAPDDDAEGRGVRLLADIKLVFAAREVDRIASVDLIAALVAMEDAPWGEVNRGRALTPHTLARMLRAYSIHPATKRTGGEVFKGYERDAFAEAWRRYLPEPAREGASNRLHGYSSQETAKNGAQDQLHAEVPVTDREGDELRNPAACNRVTDPAPDPDAQRPHDEAEGEV